MFEGFDGLVTRAVAYQTKNGVEEPVGLIVKDIDVLMSMHEPTTVRLSCQFDDSYDLNYQRVAVVPPAQYPPIDATQTPDGAMSWKEYKEEYGVKLMRTVYASAWTEIERTNCYCCTCSDNNPDPHCRNHGWAGTRACGKHNMPGKSYMQESFDKKGNIIQTETFPQSIEEYQRER